MRGATGRAAIVVALAALALALYRPALEHDFVSFDDNLYVFENRHVLQGLTPDSLRWAFGTFETGNWLPATWISHMLDVEAYGSDPRGHHLTNALLHAAVASLLFLVLAAMTGAVWPAAAAAALFAAHPLQVESVAWVAERKNVLSTLFWMLTLLAYLRYARKPSGRGYALVAALFVLGLGSKAMLLTLPAVLLILDWWPLGRFASGREAGGRAGNTARRLVAEKLPLAAISIVLGIVALAAQHQGQAVTSLEVVPAGARVARAFIACLTYIRMALWPSGLAFFYPFEREIPPLLLAAAVAALGTITVVAVAGARRRPWLLAGWGWYLVTLTPVIGIVQIGAQSVADRYAYVPLIGLAIIAVWGPAAVLEGIKGRGAVLGSLAAAAIVVLAFASRGQLSWWRNDETLFTRAIRVTRGNFVACNNLGNVYLRRGMPVEAEALYREALGYRPDSPEAQYNIGVIRAQVGRFEEAATWFRGAIRSNPDYQRAHYNLGVVLKETGRIDAAAEAFRRALQLDPGDADSWNGFGIVLMERGNLREGAAYFERALSLKPEFPEALVNLGDLSLREGRAKFAAARYREALRHDPGYALARRRLEALSAASTGAPQPHRP